MEFITGIGGVGGSLISYVIPFLFVLTIVVFFHELGHFLVARWAGVTVETFSIGFGREIYGWNDSKGTRWKISWIPLGGYVKFLGDENAASTPSKDALENMTPGCGQLSREAPFKSCGRRGGWTCREFHSRDCYLYRIDTRIWRTDRRATCR